MSPASRPAGVPASSSPLITLLSRPSTVLCGYALLTVVMTFPLVLSWKGSLPFGSGDVWQNYWNFWWWRECVVEGLNPLRSPYLFHPFGADLFFHTHSPFNQIAAMPVNLLFGPAAAYNFSVGLALTLSGFGTWLLVRELTGSAGAAFLAGLVFAYFPQTIEQSLEHINLVSVQFIPLTLYFLVRWSRSARTVDACAFGASFALTALCSWHLGLKLALVAAPCVGWLAWRWRAAAGRFALQLGSAAVLAFLLVLPLLAPMMALMAAGADYHLKSPVPRGIDPSYLLTPGYANPLLRDLVESRFLDRAYHTAGFLCYLGVVPLALAALGAWRRRRSCLPWMAVFGGGLVLAMGWAPFWDGTLHRSITLPFAALQGIPLLENLRVANRFLLLAGLGLAVLAGYGWQSLNWRRAWALPLAAGLLLVEYSWLPYPVQEVKLSPHLDRVAERPGAVLDIPFHLRSRTVHNMVAQTIHRRPISGGYLATYPPGVLESVAGEPALNSLAGVPETAPSVDLRRLMELGFRTVVVHKDRLQSRRTAALESGPPANVPERRRTLRLGGIPDEVVSAIRQQLDTAIGPAVLEDDLVAVYFLDPGL